MKKKKTTFIDEAYHYTFNKLNETIRRKVYYRPTISTVYEDFKNMLLKDPEIKELRERLDALDKLRRLGKASK